MSWFSPLPLYLGRFVSDNDHQIDLFDIVLLLWYSLWYVKKEEGNHNGCRHYWIIDPPTKGDSRGVCKFCGEVRYFANYMQYPGSRSQAAKQTLDRSV